MDRKALLEQLYALMRRLNELMRGRGEHRGETETLDPGEEKSPEVVAEKPLGEPVAEHQDESLAEVFAEFVEEAVEEAVEESVQEAVEITLAEAAGEESYGISEFLIEDESSEEVRRTREMIRQISEILQREMEKEEETGEPDARGLKRRRKKYEREEPLAVPLEERVKSVKDICENLGTKSKTTMLCFIMYDITHNGVRKKVADYLEERGCVRVQKSIFLGELERRVYREIQEALYVLQESYDNDDSILFVPVSEDELKGMRMIGREVDMTLILNRGNTLFL
ncbi:MAG: CRISPR-associated endonuclease Cas2 [Bacteroidia bacterium]